MSLKLAKIDIRKRPQVEKMVYDVMDALDPSKINSTKYKKLFATMTNDEFEKLMKDMFEDDNLNFTLDVVSFDREVDLEKAEKAAKVLGIPLEEYVILPFLNMDTENPVVTKVPVFITYTIFKRLQQTTQKKNSTSIHISERSATTGQVMNDDKNGRSSDVENAGLIAIGATANAKEFNGFRADGLIRKNVAYSSATNKGYISLEEVESSAGINDRTILNTIDKLYLGMGIKTDLLDESLVLTKTIKEM